MTKDLERIITKRYIELRKIDKIEDLQVCRDKAIEGIDADLIDNSIFEKLDKVIDGDCDCQNINDSKCVELIQDKVVETINYNSTMIYDTCAIHNKKATIMRDGYYKYLAREVDKSALYPMDVVNVYRPKEEVKRAYDRFVELSKLPAIANHPEKDLDLLDPISYQDGEGVKPALRLDNGDMLLDCELNLKGRAKEFYDKGIKEISCGWHGYYEKVNDESKDYQYIQRFKDFNHIAILERGRCGATCSIKDGDNEMKNIIDKKAVIGEVREWKGGKYKKVKSGEWVKVDEKEVNREIKKIQNQKIKEYMANQLYDEMSKYIRANDFESFKVLDDFSQNTYKPNYESLWNDIIRNTDVNFIKKVFENNYGHVYILDNLISKSEKYSSFKDAINNNSNESNFIKNEIKKHNKLLEEAEKMPIDDNETTKEILDMTKEELELLVDEKVNDKLTAIKEEIEQLKAVKDTEDEEKINIEETETEGTEDITDEMIEDGKKEPIGAMKTWGGVKYKKIEEGKWEKVVEKNDKIKSVEKLTGKKYEEEKSTMSEGELEKVEKMKEMLAKEKNKVKDEAINDDQIKAINDAFIEDSKGTYEAVEMGIVKSKDINGKLPSEIKAMVIKNVLDKEVNFKDTAILNELFDVALKNYENPAWGNKKTIKDELTGIDKVRQEYKEAMSKI